MSVCTARWQLQLVQRCSDIPIIHRGQVLWWGIAAAITLFPFNVFHITTPQRHLLQEMLNCEIFFSLIPIWKKNTNVNCKKIINIFTAVTKKVYMKAKCLEWLCTLGQGKFTCKQEHLFITPSRNNSVRNVYKRLKCRKVRKLYSLSLCKISFVKGFCLPPGLQMVYCWMQCPHGQLQQCGEQTGSDKCSPCRPDIVPVLFYINVGDICTLLLVLCTRSPN